MQEELDPSPDLPRDLSQQDLFNAAHGPQHEPNASRALLLALYDAAIAGASPAQLTSAALQDFPARADQRLWLYSLGKAAHPMAAAASATLQRSLLNVTGGVIVAESQAPSPNATVTSTFGDHPMPDRNSFTAAARIADVAAGKRGTDVSVVLISGGTSSLIAAPLRGMPEPDLIQLFDLLLTSGLDIHQMNRVRKRFLRWGAGRLALALAPCRTHVLIMSDVLSDDPADVGSGPCSPDDATVKEVSDILTQASLLTRVPPAMRDYLTSVSKGMTPETPTRTHPAFAHVSTRVIGSNRLALDAIVAESTSRDIAIERIATPITGDAAICGGNIADMLMQRAAAGQRGCVVWGGETTVRINRGAQGAGSGGRCQELALAASRRLHSVADASAGISILAAGTDGRDGATDAAGAFGDAALWTLIREKGRDPDAALQRHDSHPALSAAGALIPRRPTGTNVMDVVIGYIA